MEWFKLQFDNFLKVIIYEAGVGTGKRQIWAGAEFVSYGSAAGTLVFPHYYYFLLLSFPMNGSLSPIFLEEFAKFNK